MAILGTGDHSGTMSLEYWKLLSTMRMANERQGAKTSDIQGRMQVLPVCQHMSAEGPTARGRRLLQAT